VGTKTKYGGGSSNRVPVKKEGEEKRGRRRGVEKGGSWLYIYLAYSIERYR
jgi:hypothetical protein